MTIDDRTLETDLLSLQPRRAKPNGYDDLIRKHREAIKRKMDEGVTVAQIHAVFKQKGMNLSQKTFAKKIREIVIGSAA